MTIESLSTLDALTQPLPQGEEPETFCGDVICELVNARSALTRVRSTSPLKILTPRSPAESKTIVLSSFGGGLLGGDRVPLRLRVNRGAALTVLTQSSGKVYRSIGPWSEQSIDATVEDNGLLAIVPDPICAFSGSKYRQAQRFDLAADANLVWFDSITAGRSARGERWAMADLSSRTSVMIAGKPALCETLQLNDSPLAIGSALRLGRFDVYAVMAIIGPRLGEMAQRAATLIRATPVGRDEPMLAATSSLLDGVTNRGVIVRILGQDLQAVRKWVVDLLTPIATITGGHPWARKW